MGEYDDDDDDDDHHITLWDHRRICGPSLTETSLCGAYLYKFPVLPEVKSPVMMMMMMMMMMMI